MEYVDIGSMRSQVGGGDVNSTKHASRAQGTDLPRPDVRTSK